MVEDNLVKVLCICLRLSMLEYLDYIYLLRKSQNILFPEKKWRFLTLYDRKLRVLNKKPKNETLAYLPMHLSQFRIF